MLKNKNSLNFTKNPKILIALTAFLTIMYLLSFTKSCSSSDKREKVKTALVNQKYLNSINSITLKDATAEIILTKVDNFWTITKTTKSEKGPLQLRVDIPVSTERINNFLNELTKIRSLYKISDKINKNSALGLNNGTEFHILYEYSASQDSSNSHELIFGNQDFSLSSRYMMTGSNTQVYEIDGSLDIYLTTSVQSWAEPYIISKEVISTDIQTITVTKNGDKISEKTVIKKHDGKSQEVSKLLDLRHGGIPTSDEILASYQEIPLLRLDIENGDKSSVILKINPLANQENTYYVEALYCDSKGYQFYNSYSTISSWTYNKIIEIML